MFLHPYFFTTSTLLLQLHFPYAKITQLGKYLPLPKPLYKKCWLSINLKTVTKDFLHQLNKYIQIHIYFFQREKGNNFSHNYVPVPLVQLLYTAKIFLNHRPTSNDLSITHYHSFQKVTNTVSIFD